ncbi:hypothetical protein GCM10012284_23030 [Mangrovihabitans endophyticus]|uniref:Uncharacterized protein n=1 Tax=Mangrovihabitans endophyticus TaxID=1751298 RepID=A0A8J3FP02_9ACTN|nr:hypothetical protein GCM10012284_23030 [Mangrovihabitans endophyticus]
MYPTLRKPFGSTAASEVPCTARAATVPQAAVATVAAAAAILLEVRDMGEPFCPAPAGAAGMTGSSNIRKSY